MEFIVCKFGGSSVASKDTLKQIAKIIDLDPNRRCIVLSAPGKAPGFSVKITDLLIKATQKALQNLDFSEELSLIKKRYADIYGPLGLSQDLISRICDDFDLRLASEKDHAGKFRDRVVAGGEDVNARLFAEYLLSIGKKAQYVGPKEAGLVVTDSFGDAQPIRETELTLAGLKTICSEKIVVFPGFFGVTKDGDVATFSRGGSDLTGSILAEALDAVEYENWTDVDGIYSANPTTVEKPTQIPALTYREMRELSYIGFNVLHEEAVRPVMRKKIPIRLRSTFNLENPGTLIVSEKLPSQRDVTGIASSGGYCSFTLQKFLMNREKGFGRVLLSIFEEMNLSYEHCPVRRRQYFDYSRSNPIKARRRQQYHPDHRRAPQARRHQSRVRHRPGSGSGRRPSAQNRGAFAGRGRAFQIRGQYQTLQSGKLGNKHNFRY